MIIYLKQLNQKHLKNVINAILLMLFGICKAQQGIVILDKEDKLIKSYKHFLTDKIILEICNFERLNKIKIESKEDSIAISNYKKFGKPIVIREHHTRACNLSMIEEIDQIPSGKYDILNREDFYNYKDKNREARIYFIVSEEKGVKFYIEKDYHLFYDNFDSTSMEIEAMK